MTEAPAIPMMFDGITFTPVPSFAKRAREHYGAGEIVDLAPVQGRSPPSHRHYFAAVRECWLSLPDEQSERFGSPDHLRRWALVKAGFRDERSVVCASKAEAKRVAAFIKPMDDYAVVIVREAVVIVYTAKSQSVRAMGKQEFQASKEAVLNVLADLLGTPVAAIPKTEAA
jgi:hypothetical protein